VESRPSASNASVLDQFFDAGYDVVVFVDETEAGRSDQDASRIVGGRLFTSTERDATAKLGRLLDEAAAEEWHASARRKPDLFKSSVYEHAVGSLEGLKTSVLVDWRVRPSEMTRIQSNYCSLLAANPRLLGDWRPNAPPEEIALFGFLGRLAAQLALRQYQGHDPGNRVLVICDRQRSIAPASDWFRRVEVYVPPEMRESAFSIEVHVVVDKQHPDAVGALRWLGLIDSELWAISRLLRLNLEDGRSIDDHHKQWAASGDADRPTVSQAVLDRLQASRPRAADYLSRVFVPMVLAGRRVALSEDLVAVGE